MTPPDKVSKDEARYQGGTKARHCGNCKTFQPPEGCSLVRGKIEPQALCDYWESNDARR